MWIAFVCLFALLQFLAAPFAIGPIWYMAQGSIVIGTVFAIMRNWPRKGDSKAGEGKRPRQIKALKRPQLRRAA